MKKIMVLMLLALVCGCNQNSNPMEPKAGTVVEIQMTGDIADSVAILIAGNPATQLVYAPDTLKGKKYLKVMGVVDTDGKILIDMNLIYFR